MRLVRGQHVTFEKTLHNNDGSALAPAKQVSARVKDPSGHVVSQGASVTSVDSGNWTYTFIVPPDAPYSDQDHTWSLDWAFTTNDGSVVNVVTEFDVVEDRADLPEQTLLISENTLENLEFFLPEVATAIKLELIDPGNRSVILTQSTGDFDVSATLDGYIYSVPFDSTGRLFGDYLLRLTAKLPSRRAPQVEVVVARVVPNNFWRIYPSMTSFLDKARKKSNMINAYTQSDIYEYLMRGIGMVNAAAPQLTSWTLDRFPMGGYYWNDMDLSHHLISASCLWGLNCQSLMYSEIQFSFSGQTITLDYDGSTALGGVMDSLLNDVNTKLPVAKELMLRQTQKSVIVGVRQTFFNARLSRLDSVRRAMGFSNLNFPLIGSRYIV
jgi:hypothetical protein